jgi:hypothetical protein
VNRETEAIMGKWIVLAVIMAGCAAESEKARSEATTAAREETAVESPHEGVPPEKLEEIDRFFHRMVGGIQFRCYNDEAERTHKKYQGNLSITLMVQPGGKASDVKVLNSTLRAIDGGERASGIEQCVLGEMKGWEWPDVPAPAPYTGSISFKPAW